MPTGVSLSHLENDAICTTNTETLIRNKCCALKPRRSRFGKFNGKLINFQPSHIHERIYYNLLKTSVRPKNMVPEFIFISGTWCSRNMISTHCKFNNEVHGEISYKIQSCRLIVNLQQNVRAYSYRTGCSVLTKTRRLRYVRKESNVIDRMV